ncbi:NAD-dependent epimerase/dehydratase family protein [Microbacterium sp. ASV81]|uniref:NAD-dependent epimerase/dehydratase family protein n=1 Tax=Microbacterium capsulatum TaxID=3041921 RepID=A0ABU0XK62_9MICO|nr:NAD-dependent epimerase/dehydratase family protein [Microbacterium sp. ASV81]MDQ4214515.1 NAD-dependent epimerase/dehydratase family protein [Microbacterium sp. ASV81]
MKRILVTGGAGFLGTRVTSLLADSPQVDLVVSGDLRDSEVPGVVSIRVDVTESEGLADVLRLHRIDTVVHLAAIANPGRDASMEYRVDVQGTANVLAACVEADVHRIVVSSSGAAYGYHPDSPDWIDETDPLRGNDEFPSSRHKRLIEEMLAGARAAHPDLEQVVFRIGTILGPTVRNQVTALWDAKRILHIAGSDSRFVFVWVDDVAAAILRAALGEGPAGIYNLAGDGALSVPEIALRLGKPLLTVPAPALAVALAVGSLLRLTEHGPERIRLLRYRPVLRNDRLKAEFGYVPARTSMQAFEEYVRTHPEVVRA